MLWNWQLPKWPHFRYDKDATLQRERQFLLNVGKGMALLKNLGKQEYAQFAVEILSMEGIESSRIEGEVLDRESLQSSIKRHFGLPRTKQRESDKEASMAALLCDVYQDYNSPLTNTMLCQWHSKLFGTRSHIDDLGKYRTHPEPMQIVSRRSNSSKVFFEAPPSAQVPHEMSTYIKWFNSTASEPILGRAAIAHVYFESIHPFEDGNGRIGRLLIEKVLSQAVKKPILLAVSQVLEKRKKEYYQALERCNRTLDVNPWVEFFADAVLLAHQESMSLLSFLLEKSKTLTALASQLNPRQEKVLVRMYAAGPSGFVSGLSAENYIAITKTSRATATRDLADLVLMGALKRTGELRHTRYWLNYKENIL